MRVEKGADGFTLGFGDSDERVNICARCGLMGAYARDGRIFVAGTQWTRR